MMVGMSFSSCEVRPKSNQEMVNNFHDICTTLARMGISFQAGHCYCLHRSQLGKTNDYFTSSAITHGTFQHYER